MIMAVNIGNSVISIAVFEEDCLVYTASIETRKKATSFDYADTFLRLLEFSKIHAGQIQGAIISSVVPSLTDTVKKSLELLISHKVWVVTPGLKTGLNIKGNRNVNLGADLVCMAAAAIGKYAMPCVIVSLGTATTFSFLDTYGCLLGTSIAAGVEISAVSLREHGMRLPEIGMEKPEQFIGNTTTESMKSGIFYGTASMIDGMCRRYEKEIGQPVTRVITGRYGQKILPFCEDGYENDSNLLLEGLYQIYLKNTKKKSGQGK